MNTTVNKLINTLVDRLHIDQIYQWTYARDGKKLQMLHIHLIPDSGMRYGEAKEICASVFEKYQGVHFTLYYRTEVQRLIDQGLGRFVLICRLENKIYQNEAIEGDILLPDMAVENIARRWDDYVKTEKQKTLSFLEGYHFYLNSINYVQASFMLHQALELTLRTALMVLVGSDKKSHYLVSNIAHLKTYDSVLGRLSIKDKELAALRQLDNSYSASRYIQGYQIDKMHLGVAFHITEKALKWVEDYQAEYLQEVEKELDPEQIAQKRMESLKEKYNEEVVKSCNDNHRELILRALDIYSEPMLVKCFAYRSLQRQWSNLLLVIDDESVVHQYYLFIGLASETINTLDLQQKINQILPDHIIVTLIVEDPANIIKKARKGNTFLSDILQAAETWAAEPTLIERLEKTSTPPHRSTTYLKEQWSRRIQNARMFSTMYNELNCVGDERAVCFALATATEQVCLGLIKTFLGYSSPILNLNYLMQLVDIIAPETSVAFYREYKKDRYIFKLMVEAQKEFKHSPNYIIGEMEIAILHDRVNEFIRIADNQVERHFEKTINSQDKELEESEKEKMVCA